jgi:GxxExxY protein
MTGGTARGTEELVHGDLTREIIGAFYEVYREIGSGFLESVYQRSMPVALAARGVTAEREVSITMRYRGVVVGEYRADLMVERKVIVETKVSDQVAQAHEMQLLNYLRASGLRVGLLLNFGPRPTFRRLLL